MSRSLFILAVVVVLFAGWVFYANQSVNKPVPRIFHNMSEEIRLNDQGFDPLSPHGQVARPVPPKTVPSNMVPGLLGGGRREAGQEFVGGGDSYLMTGSTGGRYGDMMPVELSAIGGPGNVAERGKAIYAAQCMVCHGPEADGKGVMSTYLEYPVMPSLTEGKYRGYPLGQLFKSTAKGQGNMPPFEKKLTVADIWLVCAYVKLLQEGAGEGGGGR